MLALAAAGVGLAEDQESSKPAPEAEFTALRDAYLERYKPLWMEAQKAWWEANTTGSDEAFAHKERADQELIELHSDSATFARLKALKEGPPLNSDLLARELDVMYRTFLPRQADPELLKRIVSIETEVEKVFNTHRSEVNGQKLSENDVRKILRESTDSAELKAAWMGYMEVSRKVEGKLREVVKLRNEVARSLGFKNFYHLRLAEQEIDEKQLNALFQELNDLTAHAYASVKRSLNDQMMAKYGVTERELRPWHFGDLFFQEAPPSDEVDLDAVFADSNLIALTQRYYASLGLPCEDIIERSDLYEKDGKSPHAFCIDMDRAGDIRVLCNLKPNVQWADTLMHEIGHAVYDKYIATDLPFLLREPSHSITTEGMAMMLGALVKNEDWLLKVRGLPADEAKRVGQAARRSLRTEKLIFSRWSQVMVQFEQEMYDNPDQDLAKLWWDLKTRYQLILPPDDVALPGYAAKVHILTVPVYYHSYLIGDLFGAQVYAYAVRELEGTSDSSRTSLFGSLKAGKYLRDEVFGPGNVYRWDELTRRATGEPLTARHFVKQYVR